MPIYQYRCRECDEEIEVAQSFTDDALTKCPNCKKKALRKVFAAPGISFKGSGFYKNDSRGGSKSSTANGSSSESAETKRESSTDSSTDTKTDTKKADAKSDAKTDKAAPAKTSSSKKAST